VVRLRKIWQIYLTDWKNVFKVSTGTLLVIGIILLPSVYAWVNLKAMWDPYANTSGIKIAVTSQDQGAEVNGKKINIGDEVIHSLENNKKLGWTFVNEAEARKGVLNGDYYASLLIPKDFSEKITSVLTENPQKPEIDYAVNEKINAVAPKITSSGATSLTNQISQNFIETASQAVLTKLKEAGVKLEEELPTIRNIENRVLELNNRLPDIDRLGKQALELEQNLPKIKAQGQKIIALKEKIPEINRAGDLVLKIDKNLPELDKVAAVILDIQKKLPDIQKAGDRIVELDQNFNKVESALATALEDTQTALKVINAARTALPEVQKIADTGKDFTTGILDFLDKNEGALDSIGTIVKEDLQLVQQIANEVSQITGIIRGVDFDPKAAQAAANRISGRLTTAVGVLDHISQLLNRVNGYLPSQALNSLISRVNGVEDRFRRLNSTVTSIGDAIQRGEKPAQNLLDDADRLAGEISSGIDSILDNYDTEYAPAIQKALDQIKSVARNSANVLTTAQEQLPNIDKLLNDAQAAAEFGQQELTRLQQDLPQYRQKLHEAATTIQGRMDEFTNAVNKAADFVKHNLPTVKSKIHQAADFVRNDLPKAEQQFVKMADLIENKFPEAEKAVHQVANFVRTDLPAAEDSIRQAADTIRKLKGENALGRAIALLKGDVKKESDFLGSPVSLKQERIYPIPNYGSAMSPFYTTLSIWVGAMLLVSMFRVDVDDPEGQYKSYQVYFGRLMTFSTIGIFQALSVSLGDLFLLGTYVDAKVAFVLSSMLISLVFTAMTYTLVSVFGNIGKGLAVILLVLQFSSSGGTFPIATSTAFFQTLNPFVPFTYAVSLLRETVGGMLPSTVTRDVVMLFVFIGICFLFGLVLKKPLSKHTKKMAERAKETKLIP
jgi:putative membrane protein